MLNMFFINPNILIFCYFLSYYKAGKMTNEEEIERMLESGNPQIFTEGVNNFVFFFIRLVKIYLSTLSKFLFFRFSRY